MLKRREERKLLRKDGSCYDVECYDVEADEGSKGGGFVGNAEKKINLRLLYRNGVLEHTYLQLNHLK
jgi:hypothetical protein